MSTTTELPYSAVTSDPAQPLVDPTQPLAANADQIAGGYTAVPSMAALNAIPSSMRRVGMRRKVLGDDGSGVPGRDFVLGGDLVSWTGLPTSAELRDRRTQTGSQPMSTVSGLLAQFAALLNLTKWTGSGTRAPLWLDGANNELLGIDTAPADGLSFYRGHFTDWLRSNLPTSAALGARLKPLGRIVAYVGSTTRSPFWVDGANNELLGADIAPVDGVSYYRGHMIDWLRSNILTDAGFAKRLTTGLSPLARLISWTGSATRSPLIIDAANNLLLGANAAPADGVSYYEGHFQDYLLARAGGGTTSYVPLPLASSEKPTLDMGTSFLGYISYGQSLSVGAAGQPPLSTVQPYSNKMLTGGVKGTGAGFVPLVEDTTWEGGATSGNNRGETVCSGAANYACKLYTLGAGADPNSLMIWSGAPGQGGTPIAGLSKGTAPYNRLIAQVTNAKAAAVAAGRTLNIAGVSWIQGETDLDNGTTRSTYLAALLQLIADLNTDIVAITGQASPVHLLLFQPAYKAAAPTVANSIQLAQMDAVAQSARIHFIANYAFLPYNADKTHSTNVGYNWLGHYAGRALKQLVIDGAKPDCIWPKSATVNGTTLTIKLRTPTRLALSGPVQTNYGFKVVDDAGTLTLSNIRIVGVDTIQITLSRALGTNPVVRYALDYCAANNISSGGCGDLTDSTTDTCVINGATYSLAHRAPAFLLNIYTVEA